MYGEILESGFNAKTGRGGGAEVPGPQIAQISQTRKRMDPDIGCRQATDMGRRGKLALRPFDRLEASRPFDPSTSSGPQTRDKSNAGKGGTEGGIKWYNRAFLPKTVPAVTGLYRIIQAIPTWRLCWR